MAQETSDPQVTAQAGENPVQKALRETIKDRAALDALLGSLFTGLWTDFLDMLFEIFPHEPGDGSENERTYKRYRHRVLNAGNQKKRQVPTITRDFVVYQVRARTVVVEEKIKGHGPWNLPPGVKMPNERTAPDAAD